MLLLVQGLPAQTLDGENLADLMNTIRKEKFDYILPQVMRDNNIDMWIHVMRAGNPDPLATDLGGNSGVFIFTDSGGDRIERAVLGQGRESLRGSGAYDIFAGDEEEPVLNAPHTDTVAGYAGWEGVIGDFVAKRDPRRIGVNFSEKFAVADGNSHTDYLKLVEALGDKYAERIVSAENLITDLLSGRVMSEIVLFGQLCKIAKESILRNFDTIVPGVTTMKDVEGNSYLRKPDGTVHDNDDYVIQGGDLVGLINGAGVMNYRTHISEIAYVLREGETELPPEVQQIFEHGLKTREILRNNIKVGRTAGETLEILKRKLEGAGYVHNDRQEYDMNADPEKTQVHLDLHHLGKNISVADAPRISPKGPDQARNMKIPLYHTFAFEYMVFMPVPEWGRGKHLYIVFHDGVVVTERGIEFPYPPIEKIHLIR